MKPSSFFYSYADQWWQVSPLWSQGLALLYNRHAVLHIGFVIINGKTQKGSESGVFVLYVLWI